MKNPQPRRLDAHPSEPVGSRPPTEWIATAAAIAAGTAAYGDVVRHDNGGEFSWPFTTLDVTRAPDDQPFSMGPSSSFQDYFSDFYPAFSYSTAFQSGGGLEIFSTGFSDNYAAPLDAGTIIGPSTPGGSFTPFTVFEFSFTACEIYYDPKCFCYQYGECESGDRGALPEGVETYLGVRFNGLQGPQYGWIKAVRQGVNVEALAWGFQTDANTPIPAGATPCLADVDGNGEVAFSDVLQLIANWGTDGPGADLATPFDVVDFADILTLIANWGPCPPPGTKAAAITPPTGTLAALAFGSATVERIDTIGDETGHQDMGGTTPAS